MKGRAEPAGNLGQEPIRLHNSLPAVLSLQVLLGLDEAGDVAEYPECSETTEIKLACRICRLPCIGACFDGDLTPPAIDWKKAFSELPLTHIRADIHLSDNYAIKRIKQALSLAEEFGCFLELALLTAEGFSLPHGLIELLKTGQLRLSRIMVFSDEDFVSNGDSELRLLSLFRENLMDVSVGSGSNANFAKLNRNRIPTEI